MAEKKFTTLQENRKIMMATQTNDGILTWTCESWIFDNTKAYQRLFITLF